MSKTACLLIESNAFLKSTKHSVSSLLCFRISSMIRRKDRICEIVERYFYRSSSDGMKVGRGGGGAKVQRNPMAADGPEKFGRNNVVAVLTGRG